MRPVQDFEDSILVELSDRFFRQGQSTRAIADGINQDEKNGWRLAEPLTRESVYPLLREAQRRGFFALLPRLDGALRDAVARKYALPAQRLNVVPVRRNGALEIVAERAADLIFELVREVARTKERVHIGLGAGGTMTQVAQKLANRLRSETHLPKLALHALSSGFKVDRPETAPVSFFSCFHDVAPDLKCFGLFAPAMVATVDYEREIGRRGVAASFEKADEIDIVVTALAWQQDPDGELRHYIEDPRELKQMQDQGWVGDVLYRPFSEQGPLRHEASVKAVSLFELDELVECAQRKGKHVVLVAAPCAYCGKRKGPALLPLLMRPELRVWSEIVMDIPTAEYVLAPPPSEPRRARPTPSRRAQQDRDRPEPSV